MEKNHENSFDQARDPDSTRLRSAEHRRSRLIPEVRVPGVYTLLLTIRAAHRNAALKPYALTGMGSSSMRLALTQLMVSLLLVSCSAAVTHPTASKPSFADVIHEGVAKLRPAQLRLMNQIRAASPPAARPYLMFAFRSPGDVVFFYGKAPDDTRPGWKREPNAPIPFRVIGTCNLFYLNGEFVAAPGDGLDCLHWKPSRADLVVIRASGTK